MFSTSSSRVTAFIRSSGNYCAQHSHGPVQSMHQSCLAYDISPDISASSPAACRQAKASVNASKTITTSRLIILKHHPENFATWLYSTRGSGIRLGKLSHHLHHAPIHHLAVLRNRRHLVDVPADSADSTPYNILPIYRVVFVLQLLQPRSDAYHFFFPSS